MNSRRCNVVDGTVNSPGLDADEINTHLGSTSPGNPPEFDDPYRVTATITYDPNTADSGSVPVDSNNYINGADITVLGNTGGLTKAGFTFTAWNTQPDGLGADYAPGSSVTVTGADIALYARWDLDISGGGSGTGVDPYLILTADDLYNVRYDLAASYEVGANIDLGAGVYGTGAGWEPIGTSATPFTGSFNGGYPTYAISNLFIDALGTSEKGLFGRTDGAFIEFVALENVSINAADLVGALVANAVNSSTIADSYVTGTVSVERWSGSLVGRLESMSSVVRSFAAVRMLTATDAFADYDLGTITFTYFDQEATMGAAGSATALTTSEMMQQASFGGFDFGTVWTINAGVSYPYHQWYTGPAPTP